MPDAVKIDYVCDGCGAQAVSVPVAGTGKGSRVTVPHGPFCPVGAWVRGLAERGRRRGGNLAGRVRVAG